MPANVLLTSFDTWKSHHRSNASDDLLHEVLQCDTLPPNLHCLRKLPVDFQLAPDQVIAQLQAIQPQVVICCGMAEARRNLTVESQAVYRGHTIHTSVDLEALVAGLTVTEISHDAGRFVCNHLYYSTLRYLNEMNWRSHCIFVHVPILTDENCDRVLADFLVILQRMVQLNS